MGLGKRLLGGGDLPSERRWRFVLEEKGGNSSGRTHGSRVGGCLSGGPEGELCHAAATGVEGWPMLEAKEGGGWEPEREEMEAAAPGRVRIIIKRKPMGIKKGSLLVRKRGGYGVGMVSTAHFLGRIVSQPSSVLLLLTSWLKRGRRRRRWPLDPGKESLTLASLCPPKSFRWGFDVLRLAPFGPPAPQFLLGVSPVWHLRVTQRDTSSQVVIRGP